MLGSPPADLHAHPRARSPLLPSPSPHPTGTPQRADDRVHFVIGSFHADTARRQRGQHRNPRCFLFLVPLSPAETSARSRCSLTAVRTERCGFPASSQPLSAPQPSAARTERCAHRHRAGGTAVTEWDSGGTAVLSCAKSSSEGERWRLLSESNALV